jgi:hypothetical protein
LVYTAKDRASSCRFTVTVKPCIAARSTLGNFRLPTTAGVCTAKLPTVTQVLDSATLGPGYKVTWSPADKTWALGVRSITVTVSYGTVVANTVSFAAEVYDDQPPVLKSKVAAKKSAAPLPVYCAYPLSPSSARACYSAADLFTLTDNCLAAGVAQAYTCTVTEQGVAGDCTFVYAAGGVNVAQVWQLLFDRRGEQQAWGQSINWLSEINNHLIGGFSRSHSPTLFPFCNSPPTINSRSACPTPHAALAARWSAAAPRSRSRPLILEATTAP